MALQMILSDWLACGCLLSLLLAAAGGALFPRHRHAPVSAAEFWFGPNNLPDLWDRRWHSYARLWGVLRDEHVRSDAPSARDGFGNKQGLGGTGLRYV